MLEKDVAVSRENNLLDTLILSIVNALKDNIVDNVTPSDIGANIIDNKDKD